MSASRSHSSTAASDFRAGTVALRIRRGGMHLLVPRSWVRSVTSIDRIVPLPRVKPWVLGLAVFEQRPVPLLDPVVCAGGEADQPTAAVLIGRSDGAAVALLATDAPGRFVSVPVGAQIERSEGWCLRLSGCPLAPWWIEASRLATELKL